MQKPQRNERGKKLIGLHLEMKNRQHEKNESSSNRFRGKRLKFKTNKMQTQATRDESPVSA